MRKILGFNSFSVHFEMYGYLIHYCKERNYSLTIYCHFSDENGYLQYYQQIFQYPLLTFKCLWGELEQEINQYDAIVLFTDDDSSYNVYHPRTLHRTLLIEHTIFRRRKDIPHIISTRPFEFSLLEEAKDLSKYKGYTEPSSPIWALPTYPLLLPENKTRFHDASRQITVCILGGLKEYNLDYIHRLKTSSMSFSHPFKIKLIAISRDMELDNFANLNLDRFELETYKNISIQQVFEILTTKVDYLLTDVAKDNEYNLEKTLMSGCIPIAFSLLIPLIISKQTNQHYQFQHVVEFDKSTHEPIFLEPITPQNIRNECEKMTNKNMLIFDQFFHSIFTTNQWMENR